jgi:hypothetical protein
VNPVINGDIQAIPSEAHGDRLADPLTTAGDDGDFY